MNIKLARYIQDCLYRTNPTVPDLEGHDEKDKETFAAMASAYGMGGNTGASLAWDMIRRFRPEIAHYDLLNHMSDLGYLTTPVYLLEKYAVYENGFNALIGKSGAGKSFVALDIAATIAVKHSVIYVAGEGLSGYYGRYSAWKANRHAPDPKLYAYKEAVQPIDPISRERLLDWARVIQPQMLVIDTLARSAVGLEENSAKEMGQFIDALVQLQAELRCGVLVVHHTGKDGNIRGSSALFGACDSVLALYNTDGQITLTNNADRGGKNKHQEAAPDLYLKLLPIEGPGWSSAVIVEGLRMEDNAAQGFKLTDNQRIILEAIDGYDAGVSAKSIVEMKIIGSAGVYRNLKLLTTAGMITRDESELFRVTELGKETLNA